MATRTSNLGLYAIDVETDSTSVDGHVIIVKDLCAEVMEAADELQRRVDEDGDKDAAEQARILVRDVFSALQQLGFRVNRQEVPEDKIICYQFFTPVGFS